MSNYLQTYTAMKEPEILTIPKTNYIFVDKNVFAESKEAFHTAVSLDILSNAISKHMQEQLGIQYTVFPLEGVWHLFDDEIGFSKPENIEGKMMIKQPLELTNQLFQEMKVKLLQDAEVVYLKEYIDATKLQAYEAEDIIQMLHIGPYSEEPTTFAIMNKFARRQGLTEKSAYHREIYIKDVRHVTPEKFETILRIRSVEVKQLD